MGAVRVGVTPVRAEIGLVGHEEDLALIRSFVGGSGARGLLLEGPPGIGKTTLWQAGVDHARALGQRVMVARPSGAEAALSLAGLGDLLERALDDGLAAALPAPQRTALEVALLGGEDLSGQASSMRTLAVAFTAVLRKLASDGAVLVAVDDLQWLDAASAVVLAFALRRLGREPVRLLASLRVERGVALSPALAAMEDVDRLAVGPLSLGALHRVLRERLGLALGRSLLRRVHRTAAGNPLFALELGRMLAARGGGVESGDELPLPEDLRELLRERVSGLPPATRRALLYAAALSAPTRAVVASACSQRGLEQALAVGALEADGDRLRFSHPLLASVVYGDTAPKDRREVHRRLAKLVDDPERRARHLALASARPSAEVAATLEQAAARAGVRGAPAAAVELLELARRLTPAGDPDGWARRTAQAAAALLASGDWEHAWALREEAFERLPAGPGRARVTLALAVPKPGLQALCEQALTEAGSDTEVRAQALLCLAAQKAYSGHYREGLADSEEAAALARERGDQVLLARALWTSGATETFAGLDEADEHLREAERIEDELELPALSVYFGPATWRAQRLLWSDDPASARPIQHAQLKRALELGDETSQIQLLLVTSELEWWAGDWPLAEAHAVAGCELAEQIGYEHGQSALLGARGTLAAHTGQVAEARELLTQALELAHIHEERVFSIQVLSGLAFLDCSLEEHGAAMEHLLALRELLPEGIEPAFTRFQGDEIEVLIGAGEHRQAAKRIAALEHAGEQSHRARHLAWAWRGRGLLYADRGELEAAQDAFTKALAAHEELPVPFERARTLLALGAVQRRARDVRQARETLRAALAIFEPLGAAPWAQKASAELGRLGGRARKPAGELTDSERRIAELVAEGRSNKQIAAALTISVHTVEVHLSRVYRKLGVHSRTELAVRLR